MSVSSPSKHSNTISVVTTKSPLLSVSSWLLVVSGVALGGMATMLTSKVIRGRRRKANASLHASPIISSSKSSDSLSSSSDTKSSASLSISGARPVPPCLAYRSSISPYPRLAQSSVSPLGPSLLVVIDMQNVFAEPQSTWHTKGFDQLQSNVTSLINGHANAYGSSGVVFTRYTMFDNGMAACNSTAWNDYYHDTGNKFFASDSLTAQHAAELTPYYQSLAMKGNHAVIPSPTFGKFDEELVKRALALLTEEHKQLAIPPSITCIGVSTDCCVLTTCLAAMDGGMRVRVISDACQGSHHQRAIDSMRFFAPQVIITSTTEELKHLATITRNPTQ